MNTPLISIIIPTYNRAYVIKETLNSIIAQTYENWECIVVDDGSTDKTKEIILEYSQNYSRISYFERPKQMLKGANSCRNYGFENSKGHYIHWFDSDDLMHCDKLKLQVEYALINQADVIITNHSITQKNELLENKIPKVYTKSDYYIKYILGDHPVLTGEVMLNRKSVINFKFDEKLHKAQEFDFFSRVFDQKLTYCVSDKILYYYRQSEDSISKGASLGNNKQIESLIYLSKKLQNEHGDNQLIVNRAKRQGIKTYKWLVINNKLKQLLKHIFFFKNCYKMSSIVFLVYFIYSYITKKGFDKMKSYN